jgi:hypothetical protein
MFKSSTLTGRKLYTFLQEADNAKFLEIFNEAAASGVGSGQFYAVLANDEEENAVELALTITPMTIGALEAFVVMGRDITEERHLENERQRLNEELVH